MDEDSINHLVGRFGGLAKFSRVLGHKNMTTAQGWLKTGRLPRWRRKEVRAAAIRAGIDPDRYSCLAAGPSAPSAPQAAE